MMLSCGTPIALIELRAGDRGRAGAGDDDA